MPSILSEHGEGYCPRCRFVVGLGPDGLMVHHRRGPQGSTYPEPAAADCKGTGRRPAKRTPYRSRLSAFTTRAPRYNCPCGTNIAVTGQGHIPLHRKPGKPTAACPYSYHTVEQAENLKLRQGWKVEKP